MGWLNLSKHRPRFAHVLTRSGKVSISPEATLGGHPSSVNSVVYSSDGKLLASSSGNPFTLLGGPPGHVMIWDSESRILLETYRPDAGKVMSVAFSPDDRLVAAGTGFIYCGRKPITVPGQVIIWELV